MKYEVPNNADFAYNEDLPYIDEFTRNQTGFDLYMQKINELQSIFDLTHPNHNYRVVHNLHLKVLLKLHQ